MLAVVMVPGDVCGTVAAGCDCSISFRLNDVFLAGAVTVGAVVEVGVGMRCDCEDDVVVVLCSIVVGVVNVWV